MKKTTLALSILMICQTSAHAENLAEGIASAVKWGSASVTERYRYEYVDQEGLPEVSNASTLKSRLTWTSGTVAGFKGLIEVDNVTSIGNDSYNSTVNGKKSYPVVADPEATVLNQAALAYTAEKWNGMLGRQRIKHGTERFVGSVAWRQLEQTFDAAHLVYAPSASFNLDYAYSWRINTVFGPDNPNGQLDGDFHLLRADYFISGNHALAGFAYLLDYNNPTTNSSDTYGMEYTGTLLPWLKPHLIYAQQSDAGDAPIAYDANYYLAELTASWHGYYLNPGYEVLGSDDGKRGFATPLATLHKFQGFADKFLTTPKQGIRDSYLTVGGKKYKWEFAATWHEFKADEGDLDFGSELDLVASYPVTNYLTALAKYAHYDGKKESAVIATDTDKAWMMLTATF